MFVQQTALGTRRIVTSASDLTAASICEFAFLRRLDAKLGREGEVPADEDAMLARAARLGDAHEERVLAEYRADLGAGVAGAAGGVVEIPRPESMSEAGLSAVSAQTTSALHARAGLVFQATFFDPEQRPAGRGEPALGFLGFADFLRLLPSGEYEVQDTKLARKAKVTALMQLAAYAEQLERIGVPVAEEAVLILGDRSESRHRISDIAPVFRARRARLHEIVLERATAVGADGRTESADRIAWGHSGVQACGRCEVCEPEIGAARDPLLVAGIRRSQRDALIAAGINTIDRLAGLDAASLPRGRVPGIAAPALEKLALQAALQVEARPGVVPPVRVVDASALAAIPEPDQGDLFFDFEGDPLFSETSPGGAVQWGIDYLFGMVDTAEQFTAIWAHDLEAERAALIRFLELVSERRRRYPGMRIYHYAAYERTHLTSIAARHGVGEREVDELLREHVLVDLYPIVRNALRVGSRSYSIKKLEPLYMGEEFRDEAGVTSGAQSVSEYAEATAQLASDSSEERAAGKARLDAIGDYNRYDCVSTLRLRDWLLGLARAHGVPPQPAEEPELSGLARAGSEVEPSPVAAGLEAVAERTEDRADRSAIALAACAIDYHERERKSFWWAHFARLVDPVEEWAETRDVLLVDDRGCEVIEDWHTPPRARTPRRHIRLYGDAAPGSRITPGEVFAIYDRPAPFPQPGSAPGARGARTAHVIEVHEDGVTIAETQGAAPEPWDRMPLGLTPGPPPNPGKQKEAIEEWGGAMLDSLGTGRFPQDPATDLLRRATPRFRDGSAPTPADSSEALAAGGGTPEGAMIGAVTHSLRRLERSALAVQGPPGTGKTYLAARVIKRLVEEDGWRIGVVAQSHKVVENVLIGALSAGLHRDRVGKALPRSASAEAAAEAPFTVLRSGGQASFLSAHANAGIGCVIGGTAWDFAHPERVGRRELDLLIVDEAGQFSLAPTIAAAVSAERLLLLGDPQQLPQVSQGSHPEPVDTSALSWLLGDHATMPETAGYFLAETRRMRPELTEVVSELSYEGRLHAHASAADRRASGLGEPGLHWHPLSHRGNSTSSPEEAEEVVRLVTAALSGESFAGEPMTPEDLIVVAPYNAQVECVSEALERAGFGSVRVGTVDRFQGQEAVMAIVTLAASSPDDVPRGLEFLLMRNRLNVAISRAQWSAHLVSSDRLGDGLPTSPEGVAALSGYLRLTERGRRNEWPLDSSRIH